MADYNIVQLMGELLKVQEEYIDYLKESIKSKTDVDYRKAHFEQQIYDLNIRTENVAGVSTEFKTHFNQGWGEGFDVGKEEGIDEGYVKCKEEILRTLNENTNKKT